MVSERPSPVGITVSVTGRAAFIRTFFQMKTRFFGSFDNGKKNSLLSEDSNFKMYHGYWCCVTHNEL